MSIRDKSQPNALDLIRFYNQDSLWTKSTESGVVGEKGVSNLGYPTQLHAKLERPMVPALLPFPVYNFVFSQVPRLSCDLIVDTDNGTLLTKRSEIANSWKGLWHNIGTALLQGETCAEAALRGLSSEIGLKASVQDLRFLENVEFPLRPSDCGTGGYHSEISIFYHLDMPNLRADQLKLDKNTAEVGFFRPDLSKKNYGLPSPMIPQHVYMVAKHSRHFKDINPKM